MQKQIAEHVTKYLIYHKDNKDLLAMSQDYFFLRQRNNVIRVTVESIHLLPFQASQHVARSTQLSIIDIVKMYEISTITFLACSLESLRNPLHFGAFIILTNGPMLIVNQSLRDTFQSVRKTSKRKARTMYHRQHGTQYKTCYAGIVFMNHRVPYEIYTVHPLK